MAALFLSIIALSIPREASATVTGIGSVTLADNDSNAGIDGRDFTITWTQPAAVDGEDFIGYVVLLIPGNTADVTAQNFMNFYPQGDLVSNIQTTTWTGTQGMTYDSTSTPNANPPVLNNFATGSYKACVGGLGSVSVTIVCSTATNITGEQAEPDTFAPFIDHMPIHSILSLNYQPEQAIAIPALVTDNQVTASQFNNTGDGRGETAQIHYGVDVSVQESTANATQLGGNLFNFLIPVTSLPSVGQTLEYYLVATDNSENTEYMCNNPNAASLNDCKASPFVASVVAGGQRTVSGTINGNTAGNVAALSESYVIGQGIAQASYTQSGGNGSYTLQNMPNNTALDILAYKDGYCQATRFEVIGTSNLSNINLTLNNGNCNFFGSGGDSQPSGKPHVMFSGPPEFSQGVPLNEKIRVGFDQALDADTVNDSNAADASSNIYLTIDGNTKVAGAVKYCANQQASGCSALFQGDQNVVLFEPAADLTANKFYTLVITPSVTNDGGIPVEGNKPGGGHEVSFSTGGTAFSQQDITTNFGQGGAYMPPYVESVVPAPGIAAARNTKILVTFNSQMDTSTLTTSNIKLLSGGNPVQTTISVDNNSKKVVTITPTAALSASSEYEIQVTGSVANSTGMTILPPDQPTGNAFTSSFKTSTGSDSTVATIYPDIQAGDTDVPVNVGVLEFGFSEQLNPSTITTSNFTFKRGSTDTSFKVEYDPGENRLFLIPSGILAPNTTYTLTFGDSVADLAGNDLSGVSTNGKTFAFTTGSTDSTAPKIKEARCDDYACTIFFNEPMKNGGPSSDSYTNSVINPGNVTLTYGTGNDAPTTNNVSLANAVISYHGDEFSVEIKGVTIPNANTKFKVVFGANTQDLSGNAVGSPDNAKIGTVENSETTFGGFSGGGMFGPPIAGGGAGQEFKPQGFGSFTAEQFAFGDAVEAFPFVQMAGQDSNVFQVRFKPGIVVADGDIVELSFPKGTGVSGVKPDTFSPFFKDFNEQWGSGTIAFDTTYDTDGVAYDSANDQVTVKLDVTGTPGANDMLTIDLRKITNPSIPKGPESGGYTVAVKVKRASEVLANKTSMPFFIHEAGSRSITVFIYAGSQQTPTAGANGSVFLFGGGPSGPMDKQVTLTNGSISSVDGVEVNRVSYSGLQDGCYFFGTEPFVQLGGVDYYGKMAPDPVCVNSQNSTATQNIVLTSAETAGASVALTVKLAGLNDFQGKDVDIFAGGPGQFVVKSISDLNAPNSDGYTLRLPQSGQWFVGVGPAMPKGPSAGVPENLPGVPPPPMDIKVDVSADTVAAGFFTPPGTSLNTATKTATFTFAAADKSITGQVTDGNTGLSNIEVFAHSQGFGAPAFTTTDNSGNFTINVSDYGVYELGAFSHGLPPTQVNLEVSPDGADAGTDPDLFFKGKQVAQGNPLVIKLKKAAYSISGKVMDANNQGIGYAPVFASNSSGEFVGGGTSSDGSYTLFVDAGTWTVKSELPPSKTDSCGSLSTTVTITNESKSSQNITPSISSCVTLGGTVTVAGSNLANTPIFIEAWDAANDRPAGGFFRPTVTNSSGVYSAQVSPNTTYRVGTFHPDYGELSTEVAVVGSNVTDADVTSGSTADVTFSFTGGNANMEAFIELKKSNDFHTRISKNIRGLGSNTAITLKEGTYNYFVNVMGVNTFEGTVVTGNTVSIDLSATELVTLSGNVDDGSAANLAGALVSVKNTETGQVKTAATDSSGNYAISLPADETYTVTVNKAGYVGDSADTVILTASDTHDFTTAGEGEPLQKADQVIEGTIYQTGGQNAVEKGSVTAVNDATGVTINVAVEKDGTYSIPVIDGDWTLKATAPLHSKTTSADSVTVLGADVENSNLTLTSNEDKIPKSSSQALSANTGGTVNDTDNTGIKLSATAGVLESGSSDVTLSFEKNFTAGDTTTSVPLADAAFSISAASSSTIKDLNGNVEIQIDYEDLLTGVTLPTGITESDFKLAYFDQTKNEYVAVEGGFTVDTTNNIITGQVNHFTDFVVIYPPAASGSPSPSPTPSPTPSPSGGGGGGGGGPTTTAVATLKESKVPEANVKEAVATDENGKIAQEVNITNAEGEENSVIVTIKADTVVKDANGEVYKGTIEPPKVVESEVAVPAGKQLVSSVYEVGSSDVKLTFDKAVKLRLVLGPEVTAKSKVKAYYHDEEKDEWLIAGNGGELMKDSAEGYVLEVEVDHFTKFAVMEDEKTEKAVEPSEDSVEVIGFLDIKSHWAKVFIEDLFAKKIVSGKDSKHYAPDEKITRAELTKIAVKVFKITTKGKMAAVKFTDVSSGDWYAEIVALAQTNKIVGGYKDKTFKPNQPINRAEALRILLDAAGVAVGEGTASAGFTDVGEKEWFAPYVNYAWSKGIVNGYSISKFGPANYLTRGEVAKIASIMIEKGYSPEEEEE